MEFTGEEWRRVQHGLKAEGFDPGPADGVFGPRTRGAIRGWQGERGEDATGYLSEAQVQALLEAGLGLAVQEAAEKGDVAAVTRLLDAGADPDAPNEIGVTSLHLAAYEGRLEVVTLLLDRGADPDARDDFGKTPLDLAEDRGHDEVAALLRKRSE